MPDKDATLAAAHILEAIERIRAYLAGLDEVGFLADGRTRDATASLMAMKVSASP